MKQKIMKKLTKKILSGNGKVGVRISKEWYILFHDRYVLNPQSSIIPLILNEYHSSTIGGHLGVVRITKRIKNLFWWKSMNSTTIKSFVESCLICRSMKSKNKKPMGLLMPLPIPESVLRMFQLILSQAYLKLGEICYHCGGRQIDKILTFGSPTSRVHI